MLQDKILLFDTTMRDGELMPGVSMNFQETIFHRVPNINKSIAAVHCHNELGMAVDNSTVGLGCGVKQIECSINGLGARKGNADLLEVVEQVSKKYKFNIDTALISQVSELVTQITITNH